MRQKLMIAMLAVSSILLVRNLHVVLLEFPDEANQGAMWRIFQFHFPAAITSFAGFYIGAALSILYLWKKDLRYDAWAAVINEVSLVLAMITLITGMIWARIAWGVWWAVGDARLTSFLICILLYAGYLMLRRSVPDPAQRASFCAVIAIFAALDIMIVWKSIEWWRGNHPEPVIEVRVGPGRMPHEWFVLAEWNMVALALFTIPMVMIRHKQEQMQGEIDSVRRFAHEQ